MTRALTLILAATALAAGQALEFDVAVIKANKSGEPGMSTGSSSPERYVVINATLAWLIQNAWNIQRYQLTGLTGPLESDRWDMQAVAPTNTTSAEHKKMMQALLQDRFGLKVHTETREQSAYSLTTAKTGAKIQPLAPGACINPEPGQKPPAGATLCGNGSWGPSLIKLNGIPMERFTSVLGGTMERHVVDNTGLTGLFDIKLEWTADTDARTDGPSIFTAVQEQLGLKLDSVKAPVPMLVVDAVHAPSEN